MPRFCGGLAGYFGYDTVRYIEPRLAQTRQARPLGLPDILLLLSEELAVVDNLSGKLHLIVYADPRAAGGVSRCQAAARRAARDKLQARSVTAPARASAAHRDAVEREFAKAITRRGREVQGLHHGRRHDAGADLAAACAALPDSPLNLYRALRSINPSPYMFYLRLRRLPDRRRLARDPGAPGATSEGDKVTVRPIAGTRQRGATPEKDLALARELLADPKERAEHLMLIDLGRNDVGRIAKTGTVKVTEDDGGRALLARDAHRLQRGRTAEGRHDAASTCCARRFPAGTVTGAPKVRAMEMIDELEPAKRGIYGGALRLPGLQRQHGPRHRDPHRRGQGRQAARAGGRRHRRRLDARERMAGDAEQGARGALRAAEHACSTAGGVLPCC